MESLPSGTQAPSDELFIPLDEVSKSFYKHLNIHDNFRTILSAPFGTGKTYFLENFFNKYAKKYEIIYLQPVNYSVSNNEDVFELVKFDILFHLLSKPLTFKKTEFGFLTRLEWYAYNNSFDFLKRFLELSNKIGKSLSFEVGENLLKIYEEISKDFDKFSKDVQQDDLKSARKYLESYTLKKGSIYEEDEITVLINELLDQLKEKTDDNNSSNKEIVLVIDDLDRIDPEHIFRLLNIFASHHGGLGIRQNKFHFNKTIFVCDATNVKQIFHSKYGTNVDFTGYIDKFYSKEIFYFDNTDQIVKYIRNILGSIDTPDIYGDGMAPHLFSLGANNFFTKGTVAILTEMYKSKILNLRLLIKLIKSEYTFNRYERRFFKRDSDNLDSEYDLINIFKFLSKIFGGYKDLLLLLEKSSQNSPIIALKTFNNSFHTTVVREVLGCAIGIIDIENNASKKDYSEVVEYRDYEKDLVFYYKFQDRVNTVDAMHSSRRIILSDVFRSSNLNNDKKNALTKIDLFNYLKMALEKLLTMVD